MFDEEVIQKLKQKNVSVDGEKTKERIKKLWKNATTENKQAVEKLADVARNTIYRIYNTGSISAKLVISIAQILNVNPFYLIGEADEQGVCTDELLEAFLIKCGYKELLPQSTKASKSPRKNSPHLPKHTQESASIPTIPESTIQEDEPLNNINNIENNSVNVENELSKPITDKPKYLPPQNIETTNLDDMSMQEMDILLQAGLIRLKYGEEGAIEHINMLKKLLISFGK